jgi:transposase
MKGEGLMVIRGKYRRHSPHFKLQLWLAQYDRGELSSEEAAADMISEYELKIAALERKVGQLTMELDLLKKSPRLRLLSSSEESSIISDPGAVPSGGGAK